MECPNTYDMLLKMWDQMSVCLSVCLSVSKETKALSLAKLKLHRSNFLFLILVAFFVFFNV